MIELADPPINEVVCGFIFEQMPELDPLILGTYWDSRKAEYPGRDIKAPIGESPGIFLGPPTQIRAWMIAACDSFLLQIQPDRFYFNWRKRELPYPRFETPNNGILARAIAEYGRFLDFCKERTGRPPGLKSIELAKVNLLIREKHWKTLEDLRTLLPLLDATVAFARSDSPAIASSLRDDAADGRSLRIEFSTVEMRASAPSVEKRLLGKRAIRVETRLIVPVAAHSDLKAIFNSTNLELNRLFEAIIPGEVLVKRMSEGEG